MTDREKIADWIEDILDFLDWDSAYDVADCLIANGVTVQRWIPVTERLPKADAGDVLVVKNYRGKTYVDIGEIIEGEAYCYSDDYAIHPREHKLTHWMPLPKPPKEGE